MIDGLLVILQFVVFCAFCWVAIRRYIASTKQELESELARKRLLNSHTDDLQAELTREYEAAREQDLHCQVLLDKVELWRRVFDQQQEFERHKADVLAGVIHERNKRLAEVRELYSLQKELLPSVLKEACDDLEREYSSESARKEYNQSVVSRFGRKKFW